MAWSKAEMGTRDPLRSVAFIESDIWTAILSSANPPFTMARSIEWVYNGIVLNGCNLAV